MADKWSSIIENSNPGRSTVVDVNMWLGKATLDVYVLVLVLGARRLRTSRELISLKDRDRSFRLRLWCLRRCGQPVDKILCERNVRPHPRFNVLVALIIRFIR